MRFAAIRDQWRRKFAAQVEEKAETKWEKPKIHVEYQIRKTGNGRLKAKNAQTVINIKMEKPNFSLEKNRKNHLKDCQSCKTENPNASLTGLIM